MRIGIDARMYRLSVAGIGRYSQNLIKNLLMLDSENEYVLFMTKEDADEFKNPKSEIRNPKQIQNYKIKITNISHYSFSEQMKYGKIIEKEKLDLMHFLNFNYPVNYRGKFISTIHDLTLFFFPETAKQTSFLKRQAFNYTMKKACQNSEKIIAVSENTKKDIIEKFKVKSQKINVIYEAADDTTLSANRLPCLKAQIETKITELKSRYAIRDIPVLLSVGQFRPHKNLPGLVEAFYKVRKEINCKLVILGKPDQTHQNLFRSIDAATIRQAHDGERSRATGSASTLSKSRSIDKTGYKRDIIMPGFVSDEELAAWYKIATCFVFPSFYEGFGLPGLEAMTQGLPVVSSNRSSLPEIYKDAAIYFNPFKTDEIADKIKLVLQDDKLRVNLVQKGNKIAKFYSWHKTAEETLKVYQEVNSLRL